MIQKAMVLGMARSGIAAAKLLLLRGAEVWVCDQKILPERWTRLKNRARIWCWGRRIRRNTFPDWTR